MKTGIAVHCCSISSAFVIEEIDTNGEWVKIRYEYQSASGAVVKSRNKVKMRYNQKTDDYIFRFRFVWHKLSDFMAIR
jgi:hypothetical protein